jgi:hypothetical protein
MGYYLDLDLDLEYICHFSISIFSIEINVNVERRCSRSGVVGVSSWEYQASSVLDLFLNISVLSEGRSQGLYKIIFDAIFNLH